MKRKEIEIISNLNVNDIKTFINDGDVVVMVLKDGQEIKFSLMKDAFDRFYFQDVLNRIKSTDKNIPTTNYIRASGFAREGNYQLLLNEIKHITSEEGINIDPDDIVTVMLDLFGKRNLVSKAKQENNLKKYVLMAMRNRKGCVAYA